MIEGYEKACKKALEILPGMPIINLYHSIIYPHLAQSSKQAIRDDVKDDSFDMMDERNSGGRVTQ